MRTCIRACRCGLLSLPTLDDLVAGVFAASDEAEFTSNTAVLHEFFCELASEPDLPDDIRDLFDDVSFRAGYWSRFSRELEGAPMRLQVGGLLSARDPDFAVFEMHEAQRWRARQRVDQLPQEDRDFVERAARRFRASVSTCG